LYYRLGDGTVERGNQQTSYIMPAMKNNYEVAIGHWSGHISIVH
jgi:hypothetical protein